MKKISNIFSLLIEQGCLQKLEISVNMYSKTPDSEDCLKLFRQLLEKTISHSVQLS